MCYYRPCNCFCQRKHSRSGLLAFLVSYGTLALILASLPLQLLRPLVRVSSSRSLTLTTEALETVRLAARAPTRTAWQAAPSEPKKQSA